jgi:hypothetical protein
MAGEVITGAQFTASADIPWLVTQVTVIAIIARWALIVLRRDRVECRPLLCRQHRNRVKRTGC